MNIKLLRQEIEENGYNLKTTAKLLSLSADELEDKILGFAEFTVDELHKLKNILHLSLEQIHTIFFTD